MALEAIGGDIDSQIVNNNFSYLDSEKVGLSYVPLKLADKGAIGDGTADDTPAIQAAIDAAGAYRVIEADPGKNYIISAPIDLGNAIINWKGSTVTATHNGDAFTATGSIVASGLTLSANYIAGATKLTLADASSVKAGQILHIQSSTLYNSSRTYFYRGGNVLVVKVETNDVYISHAFPFDMGSSTIITLETYDPVRPRMLNLDLTNSGALPNGQNGIIVEYGLFPHFENVFVDNFVENIVYKRCVAPYGKQIRTGRAYYDGTGTSYGVVNYSCTALVIDQAIIHSGRHGFTHGGQEPCFGTRITNSQITNETNVANAFDAHQNNYDTLVENCQIDSFSVAGNMTFRKCVFSNDLKNDNAIYPMNDNVDANYIIENCIFLKSARINSRGDEQQAAPDRIYFGEIAIKNCNIKDNLVIDLDIQQYAGDEPAEIKRVIIENTNNVFLTVMDQIEVLKMDTIDDNKDIISLNQKSGASLLSQAVLRNVGLPDTFKTLNLINFATLSCEDCYLVDVGQMDGSFWFDSANGSVAFTRCPISGLGRGIEIGTSLDRLFAMKAGLHWFDKSTDLPKITHVGGEFYKDPNGVIYTLSVDSGGNPVAVAY